MAETALSFLLDQLSILLREEARLLGGLKEELQLMSDELGHMRAFLRVMEAKEEDDPRIQEWIEQVREAAYDTEDILDEFVSRFARHRADGFCGRLKRIFNSIKNLRSSHRIASNIQSIKSRITNISEARLRYQSEYGPSGQEYPVNSNHAWRYNRDDALLEEEVNLVGIEKPKQHLVSELLDSDSELKVISVVGMGGLGKTTLVKKVYEQMDVRRQFQAHVWLTVSQTCNFLELLKNLIRQLHEEIKEPIPNHVESMTDDHRLKSFVKDFLTGKRYVIVFDDVWDINFWDIMKFAMQEGNCGNRVMITTRIADVASSASFRHGYVYTMKPLSTEQSWTLFCRRTFGDYHGCPEYLKDVSMGILSKCEGLPLAIVVISGFLALKDQTSISEWEIVRRSLGAELEGSGKLDRIKKIISMSYNELPYYLKPCLLYLSIFPEDDKIKTEQLIQLWIAEGFVHEREGMMIEEIAWIYLNQLINRSLVQVIETELDKREMSIHIHDLLREIIISKSREHNMVMFIAPGKDTRWPEKVRRVAIGSLTTDIDEITRGSRESNPCKYLRSLISFGWYVEPLSKSLGNLCVGSRLLRVLDLKGAIMLEEIPDEIFNLFHLKYLCLASTRVKSVSKSIGKLQNLVSLDLNNTQVSKLPTEILKLLRLRHLKVGSHDAFSMPQGFEAPSKMGGLVSLQTLEHINADNDGTIVREIGKPTELRRLGITRLRREQGKELWSSLQKLTKLEHLCVSSIDKDEIIDLDYPIIRFSSSSSLQFLQALFLSGRLEKVPQWVASRQGLTTVCFTGSQLRDDPLESLQNLPNLRALELAEAYQGESICFKAGGFPKLKLLNLWGNRGLKGITIQVGALPQLQKLLLSELELMEDLPWGIHHLTPHIQHLTFMDMSHTLTAKLLNIDEQQSDEYTQMSYISRVEVSYLTQDGRKWHYL